MLASSRNPGKEALEERELERERELGRELIFRHEVAITSLLTDSVSLSLNVMLYENPCLESSSSSSLTLSSVSWFDQNDDVMSRAREKK